MTILPSRDDDISGSEAKSFVQRLWDEQFHLHRCDPQSARSDSLEFSIPPDERQSPVFLADGPLSWRSARILRKPRPTLPRLGSRLVNRQYSSSEVTNPGKDVFLSLVYYIYLFTWGAEMETHVCHNMSVE